MIDENWEHLRARRNNVRRYRRLLQTELTDLGSVLNKDSNAGGVVIQGFRIGGGLDEEAALLAERCGVETD
jgi:hypothetical protein